MDGPGCKHIERDQTNNSVIFLFKRTRYIDLTSTNKPAFFWIYCLRNIDLQPK